jgi:drug/metabolite transporter (DMT)-like permease
VILASFIALFSGQVMLKIFSWPAIITLLFFALIVNYFFLNETPLPNEVIGGIFIFLAANIVGIDWGSFRKLWKMGKNLK